MEKSNTPNPLVPKGSLQDSAKGKSSVRIAFFTIAAIHVLFITVFLIAGCRKDATVGDATVGNTNEAPPFAPLTNDNLGLATTTSAPVVDATANVPTNVAITPDTNQPIVPEAVTPATIAPAVAAPGTHDYTVARGDTLAGIAKKNGISLQALMDANQGVEPRKLKAGQKIQVPTGQANGSNSGKSTANDSGNGNASENIYTVKAGDTLIKIARTHGVTLDDLRKINNLRPTKVIQPGNKLKIPARKQAPSEQPASAQPGNRTTPS